MKNEMQNKKRSLPNFLLGNSFQLSISVLTVVVAILNIWITTKLSPVAQDIAVIVNRTDAIESELDRREAVIDLIRINATKIDNIEKKIDRIEDAVSK